MTATEQQTTDLKIEIIEYSQVHHDAFREINVEWLDKYGLKESHDMMVLGDPQGTIIDRGGFIWLAVVDGVVVGSSALMKDEHDEYELAKMAVRPAFQGRGISRLLIEISLRKARDLGAHEVILFSNHQLTTAISLYQKYGFEHVAVENSPFATADVKMVLKLQDN